MTTLKKRAVAACKSADGANISTADQERQGSSQKTLQDLLTILFAALILTAASGCTNTIGGIGDDVEEAGDEVEEALD